MARSGAYSPITVLLQRCSLRPPDEAAWQEFVERYHSTIRATIIRTFLVRAGQTRQLHWQVPEDLINDLVQNVYLKLVEDGSRSLDRFMGEHQNSIFQYLSIMSINVVRDHFREGRAKKRPRVTYSLDQMLDSGGDGALPVGVVSGLDGRPAGRDGLAEADVERALNRVVSGKNRSRDILIFKLRYFDGLTLEEIASSMGLEISAISVGSILNRTVRRVRKVLGHQA